MGVCVSACALQFLHEKNISHLDLKPQNILLSGNVLKLAGETRMSFELHLHRDNSMTEVCVCVDFGFAQYMSPWDEQHALRGSPLYMAPEMVCRRHYDARVDLWSVGVILYGELTQLSVKVNDVRALNIFLGFHKNCFQH